MFNLLDLRTVLSKLTLLSAGIATNTIFEGNDNSPGFDSSKYLDSLTSSLSKKELKLTGSKDKLKLSSLVLNLKAPA
ncbi:MAG: hypothetical protein IAE91_12615 [Ignavibacteriaceae bacterium]|nr:hypothetical protein [Ignavibacteriaceae bacterium]